MGLIRVALGAVGGVISDQYKEYFICDALPNNVLVRRATRNTDGKTRNNGSENIISNGSLIVVNPGQAMAIVDQGQIVEFTAEPGPFVYDSSAEPSIFEGSLGKNIVNSFKTIGRRIAFGGNTARDQRVYYFNLLEIKNNLFGTPTPVLFRAVDRNIGLDMDVDLRCNGTYTFFLDDPILFFEKFSGNIKGDYTREDINDMLRNSFVMALQPALGRIAALEIRPNQLGSHVVELRDAMRDFLKPDWDPRGIRLGEITMNPPSLPADQAEAIRELQKTAVLRSADMAAATLTGAQAEAMKAAAGNAGGAAIGFMGMNMAQMSGGMNAQQLFQMSAAQKQQQMQQQQMQQPQQPAPAGGWTCSCGTVNTSKFCQNCGKPKPAAGWTCSCGAVNTGRFCAECGKPKPAGEPLYKCDKCGWMPADPKHPPKFCPECGDPFDVNDMQ